MGNSENRICGTLKLGTDWEEFESLTTDAERLLCVRELIRGQILSEVMVGSFAVMDEQNVIRYPANGVLGKDHGHLFFSKKEDAENFSRHLGKKEDGEFSVVPIGRDDVVKNDRFLARQRMLG